MARIKTYAAAAPLLPSELNAMEDDYERSFATYRTIHHGFGPMAMGNNAGGDWILDPNLFMATTNGQTRPGFFWLDPAAYAAGSRAARFRVRVWAATNSIAPGVTLAFRLAPVTPTYGPSGQENTPVPGAAVAGSTLTFPTVAADFGPSVQATGDFTIAAAGAYAIVVNTGAGWLNSALVAARCEIAYRQV